MNHMLRVLALPLIIALAACGKSESASTAASPILLLQAQDLVTIQSGTLVSGPVITGSIEPERRADLRAEVSSVVLQVYKDNGDVVRRGDLLVRLDDSAIRDSLASAQEAVRAASQSFEQAVRQYQRLKTLRESGMATTQQLEDAEMRRNNTQSDLSAAKSRAAQARQQLDRTLVRAPFDGVVSGRKVSAGDTAQIGKELLKVMDPASLRFEGLVAADALGDIKLGQTVSFKVNGYGQKVFAGAVKRVNPLANASTRQVEVLVAFASGEQPQLAGLYAEGQIEAASKTGLMVPALTLAREGDKVFAWRFKNGTVQKLSLELGERNPRLGDFEVHSGLNAGDQLIRNPTSMLKDGQKAELATAASASSATASSTGS